MTGFGSGAAPLNAGRVSVEIRALNHKHQDIRLRLPTELGEHASFFEQAARQRLGRGRYDISVRHDGQPFGQPTFDAERIRSLFSSLKELHRELTPDEPLRLDPLLALPEVLSGHSPDPKQARTSLVDALEQATQALSTMRTSEGAALKRDLVSRLRHLQSLLSAVEHGASDLVSHHRERLKTRVEQLLGDPHTLDHQRLEQEVALLADRSDITEELVRLRSHSDQFQMLLDQDDPVGRRLDFLLQEMTREVNTIGSKSQHAPVAHLVIEMKSEVERLREQVQNVA